MKAKAALGPALAIAGVLAATIPLSALRKAKDAHNGDPQIVDLSLTVSPELPCVWPVGMTPYMITQTHTLDLDGFRREQVLIDEHTGTQWDAPAHFMARPGSGVEGAGPNGTITSEKVKPWKFLGEACVIDVHELAGQAAPGESYAVPPEVVQEWEKTHRPLRQGDVVVFRADYSDRYYKPFPAGDRYVRSVLAKKDHAWAGPDPDCVRYLGQRGVWGFACDGPSLGPLPNFAVPSHLWAAKMGMIGTEGGTNFKSLPTTGSLYVLAAAKHAAGSGGEARAFAITNKKLAARLIAKVREKRVADLSVVLTDDHPVTWQGFAPGREAARYFGKTLNEFNPARGPYFARTHVLDSQVGTHCAASAHVLPPKDFNRSRYSKQVQSWLKKYEAAHGPLPSGGLFADQLPLNELMGKIRLIDLRSVIGSTKKADWPASPMITAAHLKAAEEKTGALGRGEVVLLHTGYVDTRFKPLPDAKQFFADPLAGESEGWPALTLDALDYLGKKGVRCIAIDSPTAGGVDPEHAQMVSWFAASRRLHVVEFLSGLEAVAKEKDAFFLFAPIKIRNSTGGYGRALAVY
ncbi:MAG: cyclase family protein [Roseibacillus sp.]|nr:cyclase family protein [Roseibacillus sp.]